MQKPTCDSFMTESLMIMHDLEYREEGEPDAPTSKHISMTPIFEVSSVHLAEVANVIEEITADTEPFCIRALRYSMYGRGRYVPVVEIEDVDGRMTDLRSRYLDAIRGFGCTFRSLIECNEPYRPHTQDLSFAAQSDYWVDTMSIIQTPKSRARRSSRIFRVMDLGGLTNESVDSQLSKTLVQ